MILAKTLAALACEKKARTPRLLNVEALTSYTNYLLIVTATSDRHARALADFLVEELKAKQVRPLGVEGMESAQWVLIDFGDVVVHIFQEAPRSLYDLDGLWNSAQRLTVEEVG